MSQDDLYFRYMTHAGYRPEDWGHGSPKAEVEKKPAKKRAPKTNKTTNQVNKIKQKIADLHKELEAVQEKCEHEWEVVSRGNDHDGWSHVEITYYETRKCKHCTKIETIETGKSMY